MESVRINHNTAQKLADIATKRAITVERLINEILANYVADDVLADEQSDVKFLTSISGLFESGYHITTEDTKMLIREQIVNKYSTDPNDSTD